MSRPPSALNRTSGRSRVNTKNSSGSIRANRVARRSRTRWRNAPVAARPASIHPPNAMTIVVRFAGGSRSNSTLSIIVLSAVASLDHRPCRSGLLHPHRSARGEGPLDRVDQLVALDGQIEVDVEGPTAAQRVGGA